MAIEIINKIKNNYMLILVILLGIIPLLWFKPEHIVASGDYFPLYLNSDTSVVFSRNIFLWNNFQLGQPSIEIVRISYGVLWGLAQGIGVTAGLMQVMEFVFFFMGAGISMYFLTRAIFPERKYAPLFASIFYMFNMYVVVALFYHRGVSFTYVFLPMLMFFLMRVIKDVEKRRATSKNIIYFGLVSVPTLSLAASNAPLVVIVFLALISLCLYYIITQKRDRRGLLINFLKLACIVGLLNLWWIVPYFNFYNSAPLASSVTDIAQRAWTHQRASFLNLFWLNPSWTWNPTYYPFFSCYSNPILIIIMFVPIILAFSSLLFNKEKNFFVIYASGIILLSLFIAKGLHEPFSSINLFLYDNVPGMYLFRNPTLKFTQLALPFLALLIGFSCDKMAGMFTKTNLKSKKKLIVLLFIPLFMISSFPLLTGQVIRGSTVSLPSSYVKFPNYWIDAANWLNNQSGDYRILLTPNDDFYQMPYTWGYYGNDIFPSSLISKPLLQELPGAYVENPEYHALMSQVFQAIRSKDVAKFQALLGFLNVRYILQRGDIAYNLSGRNIISESAINEFLSNQRNIKLVRTFGELTVYEYLNAKPLFYVMGENSTVEHNPFNPLTYESTYFDFEDDGLEGWTVNNPGIQNLLLDNDTYITGESSMRVTLNDSIQQWSVITSPLVPVPSGAEFNWTFYVKGENVTNVHAKIAEYDSNKNFVDNRRVATIGGYDVASFDWTRISFAFTPNQSASYIALQIWQGKETERPLPNILWVDNLNITTYIYEYPKDLPTYGTNELEEYQEINPTKYCLKVNTTEPFMLVFAESYNPKWNAYANGYTIESSEVYGVLNSFWVNKTGEYTLTIEYTPQNWSYIGSAISLITTVACIAYLTYVHTKTKIFVIKIKQKFSCLVAFNKRELNS
jgi:hypothetical protein